MWFACGTGQSQRLEGRKEKKSAGLHGVRPRCRLVPRILNVGRGWGGIRLRSRAEVLMQLKLTKRTVDGILAIGCSGRIVFGDESSLLREDVKKAIADGHKRIVLNLGEVNYIDSGGLGTLVALHTTAHIAGATIKLANLTKRVGDLLQVTKLLTVFEVHSSEYEALEAFRQVA
jgi:anti-sigma B factor antagonist